MRLSTGVCLCVLVVLACYSEISYSAVWAVCSDSVANGTGATTPSSDCANTAGQFSSSATFSGVGGTSASAPAFAGIIALVIQATGGRLGQADTVLYQLAQAHPSYFHDITGGDNSVPCATGSPNCSSNGFLAGYNTGAGYDLASGLGSVDAAAIVNHWKSIPLGSTSTTLLINGSSASYSGVHGANLTLNVGVTGSSGTPSGVVAITDTANMAAGGTASGPQNDGQLAIPITGGSGSTTYNGLPGGIYATTARYGGDTSFAASTSTPISVSITPEASTTALSIGAYDPSTGESISTTNIPYSSYIIADAVITGTAEGSNTQGVATGSVTFLKGNTTLGTGAVGSGNQASWPPLNSSFPPLPGGSYNLTAQYSGDTSYKSSTSSAAQFTVVPTVTTVSAQSTLYVMTVGDSATTIVNVNATPNGGVPPTGSADISADGQTLSTIPSLVGSGSLAFGDGNIQGSQLAPGANVVTVKYNGRLELRTFQHHAHDRLRRKRRIQDRPDRQREYRPWGHCNRAVAVDNIRRICWLRSVWFNIPRGCRCFPPRATHLLVQVKSNYRNDDCHGVVIGHRLHL